MASPRIGLWAACAAATIGLAAHMRRTAVPRPAPARRPMRSLAGVMREISGKLSDEDIAALSAYLQNVRRPVAAAASDGRR